MKRAADAIRTRAHAAASHHARLLSAASSPALASSRFPFHSLAFRRSLHAGRHARSSDSESSTASSDSIPPPSTTQLPPFARATLQASMKKLSALQRRYQAAFPSSSNKRGVEAMTSKSEWRAMQAEARQLLSDLLSLAPKHKSGLSCYQWGLLVLAMKNHRLHDMPLRLLAAIMVQQQRAQQHQPGSSEQLRLPAKCVAMILEGVVKAPEWAAAAAAAAVASDDSSAKRDLPPSALTELFAGSKIPTKRRGVELAEAILRRMISPALAPRFEVDQSAWNVVLQGLTQLCGDRHSDGFQQRMQRARSFYDSIPDKSGATHNILLTAYQRAGLDSSALELRGDPRLAMSPSLTNARLAYIHRRLDTPQRQAATRMRSPAQPLSDTEVEMLRGAEELWRAAKEKPLERLDAVVTSSMLKLHHLMGDVPRQLQIIQEALQLEAQQSEPRPVYVNAACYGQLFHSLAVNRDSRLYVVEARSAYDTMSANPLRFDDVALTTYFKYLQHSGQTEELQRVWADIPTSVKEGNPRIFVAMLNAIAPSGKFRVAEEVVHEMQRLGMKAGVEQLTAQLGCFKIEANWAGAEQVWQRMIEEGLQPTSITYCTMMQIYMADGSPAQLAKLESLYSEMMSGAGGSSGGAPIRLQPRDFEHLIKTAHWYRLGSEVRTWAERAKKAGVWEELDAATHRIVERWPENTAQDIVNSE